MIRRNSLELSKISVRSANLRATYCSYKIPNTRWGVKLKHFRHLVPVYLLSPKIICDLPPVLVPLVKLEFGAYFPY